MAYSTSDTGTLRIEVRFYSVLRHRGDQIVDRLDVKVAQGSRVLDLLDMLDVPPLLNAVVAVNDEVVDEHSVLPDGARVAIIPPIAGG